MGVAVKFCTNCGQELQEDWAVCPKCGTRISATSVIEAETPRGEPAPASEPRSAPVVAPASPVPPTQPGTSGSAVASLVLGILWLWGVGSLLAVVLGFRARSQIKQSDGRVGGNGLAVAGITLGVVGIFGAILVTLALVGLNETLNVAAPGDVSTTPTPGTRTRAAHIGSTIALSASNNAKLNVTAQQVIDPASGASEFSIAEPGKRLVGVKLLITNVGTGTYDGNANTGANLIGSDGQTYTADFNDITGCTNFSHGNVTLAPEAAATGCVVFQVPNGVSVAKVRFNPNSGIGGDTGEWINP